MPINETVYLHRNHRVCIGKNGTQKIWNKYSFWTHSSDVWFDDGTTLESKISGLRGITTNIDSGAGYAADVTLVKAIRDSLKGLIDNLSAASASINSRLGGLSFYEDSNGKWVVGADSVPKKLGSGGLENLKKIAHNDTAYYSRKGRETEREELWYGGQLIETRKDLEFNVKLLLPQEYLNFTADNFYLHVISTEVKGNQTEDSNIASPETIPCEKHYNAATGILTISNLYAVRTETRANDHGGTTISGGVKDFELLIIE